MAGEAICLLIIYTRNGLFLQLHTTDLLSSSDVWSFVLIEIQGLIAFGIRKTTISQGFFFFFQRALCFSSSLETQLLERVECLF